MMRTFAVFLGACALASGAKCPGSASKVHAQCQVNVTVEASCKTVMEEVVARADGSAMGTWTDPHNGGKYAVTDASPTGDAIQLKRVTGNGKYTDLILFTLTELGSTCNIEGCSQSQVFSIGDFSTNYCNQRMLYCGSEDGCKPVKHDFKVVENSVSPSIGAGSDKSKCIVNSQPTAIVARKVETQSMQCPGSPAYIHASCQQEASIGASCDVVAAEIQARVAGQANGTWYDPHNKGTYSILSVSSGVMQLKRVTGNGKYTDKITVSLSGSGNSCTLAGCSESQVTSVADFSTNYCNVRMLYCGSSDGCKPAKTDLTSKLTSTKPSIGASTNMGDCLKV